MRDLNRLNAEGVGKSRGYAFVDFVQHEHALKCLKHLNNNPDIFTDEKRPIVEFSLENRAALNAKQKRLENFRANKQSKEKNEAMFKRTPKPQSFKPKIVKPVDGVSKAKSTAKPFPSHFGPKIRHKKRRPASDKEEKRTVKEKSQKQVEKRMKNDKKVKRMKNDQKVAPPKEKRVKNANEEKTSKVSIKNRHDETSTSSRH